MCFSPEVDALAGLIVGAIGLDAARHVRRPGEWPLAVLPLVFAAHQLVEALVWWRLEGRLGAAVGDWAEVVYLLVAFGVLPVLVPVAVLLLEPAWRRARLVPFILVGVAAAAVLLSSLAVGPVAARVEGHHLVYEVDVWHGGFVTGLYVVATCGALVVSAHRHIRWYAAANLVAVAVLAWFSQTAFLSLWCVWAAITSVAIVLHLRYAPRLPESSAAAPAPVAP